MNDLDVAEIRTRLVGLSRLARKLDALSTAYKDGQLTVFDDEIMPLSAAQKNGIKTRFTDLLAKANALADSLPAPTALPGVPDAQLVLNTPPPRVLEAVQEWYSGLTTLVEAPALQADGTLRTLIDAATQNYIANGMATVRDVLKNLFALMAAKVP